MYPSNTAVTDHTDTNFSHEASCFSGIFCYGC
jgi:hypothetical protein